MNATREEDRIRELTRRMHMLQTALPDLADRCGAVFIPLQDVFDRAGEQVPMSYLIWDNIHPTMAGHRLIADRWMEIAEQYLSY